MGTTSNNRQRHAYFFEQPPSRQIPDERLRVPTQEVYSTHNYRLPLQTARLKSFDREIWATKPTSPQILRTAHQPLKTNPATSMLAEVDTESHWRTRIRNVTKPYKRRRYSRSSYSPSTPPRKNSKRNLSIMNFCEFFVVRTIIKGNVANIVWRIGYPGESVVELWGYRHWCDLLHGRNWHIPKTTALRVLRTPLTPVFTSLR